jgi:hypothetical protein
MDGVHMHLIDNTHRDTNTDAHARTHTRTHTHTHWARRYARTAKKIDIKALKESIWDRVAGPAPEGGGPGGHRFTETLETIPVEKFPEVGAVRDKRGWEGERELKTILCRNSRRWAL